MGTRAYYNENDPFAAEWLKNLIDAGHIAPGDVDTRSIEDVCPDDLRLYTQCHFFAGIGIWSYALRNAGWTDDLHVWTGSCPCQPYSPAGHGGGFTDERHLWPSWYHLINERRPAIIFGEQVSAAIRYGWADLVRADLEAADYAVGFSVFGAHSVGAPHIRQRLWFVAEGVELAEGDGRVERRSQSIERGVESRRELGRLADAAPIGLVEAGRCESAHERDGITRDSGALARSSATGPLHGFWRNADWLLCRDGRWRAVESGTFPLAHGVANRVGRLRGYGNGINSEAAEAFIRSYTDTLTFTRSQTP